MKLRSPLAALHAGGFQFGAWALQLMACLAVLEATAPQVRTPVCAAAAVLVAVNLTAIFPLTPSNIGVFQAATIAALAPFGVRADEALACGIILQAVEVTCALALGIPALVREGIHWSELPGAVLATGPSELASDAALLGSADHPAAPVG